MPDPSERTFLLSKFLTEYLHDLDDGGDPNELQEANEFAARIQSSFETFGKLEWVNFVEWLRSRKGSLEYWLDDFYTRDTLKKMSKIVNRTIKLSHIIPDNQPPTAVNIYLREATRSYIYGLWQSAVALSRAAIEQALKDQLGKTINTVPGMLSEQIEFAAKLKLIDGATEHMCSTVQFTGNRILHGATCSDEEAWAVLVATRAVLQHLYGAK